MARGNKFIYTIGTLLFTLGLLIGFILLGAMVWGDLEASLFSSAMDGEKTLTTLRCPVFISPYEEKVITAKLKNPTDRDWERYTRAFISEGFITLIREIKKSVPIPAGGSETVAWEIYPEDAAFNRIVFFRVYVHAKYPYPSLDGSCGIMMLDLWGLTGTQILILMIIGFLGMCAAGAALWKINTNRSSRNNSNQNNSLLALAVFLLIGMVISYMGSWVIGLLLLVASTLMVGINIGRRMTAQQ